MGTDARDRGVGVSLISVRGAEIQLATVGQVATLTGGSISIADASALADALRSVASPTVASRVQITVRAPNGVSFYSPTTGLLGAKVVTADLGSAFLATDFVVGFDVEVAFAAPSVRFQVELEWSNSQGQRLLRLETVDAPVSEDRATLERRCHMAVPALAAIRRSAALASAGAYKDARIVLISALRLLQRGMRSKQAQREYVRFIKQGERLDGFMRELAQQAEMVSVFAAKKPASGSAVEKKDDYVARNVHRARVMTLQDWSV